MMELTCAVVLILAGAVTATPHGYGVKGGASSRADASASAGAFGGSGIPVPVPLGASYSGSFSKSSASSFASSSASSSSSSSAFSYSGSGAGHTGIGNNGANAQGTGGCGSGSCQFGGAHGILANHGGSNAEAGLQTYNAANAVATAGAAAGSLSGAGCQGSNCNDHSTKCTTGHCEPHISSESSNKCSSGKCGSGQGDNDISVNADTTQSTHDSKEQTLNYDKKETGYTGAVSDCSTGNCGSSAGIEPHAHGTINSYGSSLSDNNKHSETSDSDIFTGYRKPALHLEAPKLGSSCTSGNCASGPAGTGTGNLPSSYNVPIHGAYNSNGQKPACTSGNCDTSTYSNSASTNYLISHGSDSANDIPKSPSSVYSPSSVAGATNCVGQNCGIPSNPTQIGGSFSTPSLSQGHNGLPTHSVPTQESSSTGCKTPDCSGFPSAGFPSGATKPNYETGPSSKIPEHTESFGDPAVKPNKLVTPALTGGSSYTQSNVPSINAPSIATTASGCTTPDCAGYTPGNAVHGVTVPSTSFEITHPGSLNPSTADAHFGSFGVTKPITSYKEKLPAYTGGFGGPTGVLKPNEFNAIHEKPGHTHSGSTHTPSSSTGTSSCSTPNCAGYPNAAAAAAAGAHGLSASFGAINPNIDASSTHEKLPPYTGGFGGPAGVLTTVHGHGSGSHSTGYSHSGIPSVVPSTSGNTAGCKTPNCAGYPTASDSSARANAVSGSYDLSNPSASLIPASHKLPSYTGGFGAPDGVIKPNEIGVPVGASVGTMAAHPASPSYSSPSAIGPSTACKTSNCAYPTAGASADAQSVSFDSTKLSTELPVYTSGFGGPTGVYKPNEYTAPSSVSYPSSSGTPDCKTANCAGANFPAGVHKPDDVNVPATGLNSPSYSNSGTYSTSSGSNGYHTAGVISGSNAQSATIGVNNHKPSGSDLTNDKLPAYTGGFGAPSGVLKPNKAGVPTTDASTPSFVHSGSPLYIAPSTTGTSGCKTPNCASYPSADAGAAAGATAHAGSHGVTKPISDSSSDQKLPPYTGGFGAPSGILRPNEYTAPAVGVTSAVGVLPAVGISPIDLHKPTGTTENLKPASCTSETCAHQVSSPHAVPTGASIGAHATAGASADAEAVAYNGGFGGPPGYLKPYDHGESGAAGVAGKETIGTQFGSHHSPSGISSHGASGTGSQAVSTTQAGGTGLSGAAQAGAVAHGGATATATSGAISGYNLHGSHSGHSGHGVKGGCGGGCGGSGGSSFGYSGGLGLSKLGYVDGLSGSLSSSGASAKSLAGATAFSHGGSFASSSATAHASAGASVKGGYGRR